MHKKEFTSFDVAAAVRELKATILGSRVNNIYQLDPKTFLIKLHKTDSPAFRLLVEAGRRLHLTDYALEKPVTPPAFCMALRKYLRSARLKGVEQYEFERVVIMSFDAQGGGFQLVLELFGDGNIVLVDQDREILQALVYRRMRDRNVVRGEALKFAPSTGKNPLNVGREEFLEKLKGFGDVEVVRAVARFVSIGGVYAEEILLRAGLDKTTKCNTLVEDEIETVFDGLQSLLVRVQSGPLEPCVVLDESANFVDVVPFRLKRYEGEGFKLQFYGSFNEALDEFYARVSAIEQAMAGVKIDELKREAERLKRIVADQEKALSETAVETEQFRRIGDAIYAHIVDLQVILDRFLTGKRSGKPWKEIVSEISDDKRAGVKPWAFFESFDAKGLLVYVCVDGLTFGLNLQRTLYDDASRFYEQGKRAKQRSEGTKAALADSREKLAGVESKISKAETSELDKPAEALEALARRRVKHREWFEKFRWFVSSDGFLVVAGRDAVTNEVLIKKYTEKNDVVFHADIVGAPFVVVKTEGKKPGEQCLREAGEFAAAFSRGWREGFGSVDVYWVKPEQLSKGGPSGESVGHGAFVVRGERNWMRGVSLRIAIGVAIDEEEGVASVGGGPIEAVKAKTNMFVVVVPGDSSGKELFRHVLKSLAGRTSKELREAILKLSVEEIREFIPYGKGIVLDS